MTEERDRQSVGLSPEGQVRLERIEALGWFGTGQDVARFAMSYAMRAGVTPGSTSGTDTRWTIGLFDDTGEMRDLIGALYPGTAAPVKAIEHFVDEGLRLIAERIDRGETDPAALL
ncbi:MAG TPA: hypothetical protein VGQ83_19085 [Polyangia bacterium]|jgi:hypothetical protein